MYNDGINENDNEIDGFIDDNLESIDVISSLPFNLITCNLKGQIENRNLSSVDYFSLINQKLEIIKDEYIDDAEMVASVEETRHLLYVTIFKTLEKTYGLYIGYEGLDIDEINELSEALYKSVIINYKDIMVSFFKNYISKNKKHILSTIDASKKNVTTISMKKILKNKEDALIVSNINKIMDLILDIGVPVDEFLSYADNGEYEVKVLSDFTEFCIIDNDFSKVMFDILRDEIDMYEQVYNTVLYDLIK